MILYQHTQCGKVYVILYLIEDGLNTHFVFFFILLWYKKVRTIIKTLKIAFLTFLATPRGAHNFSVFYIKLYMITH